MLILFTRNEEKGAQDHPLLNFLKFCVFTTSLPFGKDVVNMLQLGNGCDGDNATNRRGFPDKTKASLATGCCYSRTCVHRVHSFVLLGPDNFCTGLKSEDLRQITGTF